ncbi:hypothetical protein GCM10027341_37260 [Spirosoma knui]
MKRFLYTFCLVALLVGLNSCKKDEAAPAPAVVGKWSSDFLLTSGFVAPYADNNGLKLNPLLYGINDVYDIKADKSFVLTDRSSAVIQTFPGTWDYTGTELNLKYDDGNTEKLTYDAANGTPRLAFPVVAVSDTLQNPTTKLNEVVRYNIQLIYSKQ